MATKNKPTTKTTHLTMRNDEVLVAHEALQMLAQMRLPTATAMQVRRLIRIVGETAEDVRAERLKLVQTHALLDELGAPQADDQGKIVFESDSERQAYGAANRELMALKVEIEALPLRASELGIKEIQAALLVALDDLLVDDLG